MQLAKFKPYTFQGKSGKIPATLLTPDNHSELVAVVLPGAGYSCKQPLLYFAIQVFLKLKYQVLTIDKVYGEDPNWTKITTLEEALKVVEDDSHQMFEEIMNVLPVDAVLGRSLGTYIMASALEKNLIQPKQIIWQTPSLNGKWPTMKKFESNSFAVIGTADHRYDEARSYLPNAKIVIDNADHAMEISNDPIRSIEVLKQVTAATEEWLQL